MALKYLILDLPIIDHLVMSEDGYTSFEETGLMSEVRESIEFVPQYKLQERWEKERREIEKMAKAELKAANEKIKNVSKAANEKIKNASKEVERVKKEAKNSKSEGVEEGRLEIAKNMKNLNIGIDIIIKSTGLSKKDIEKL